MTQVRKPGVRVQTINEKFRFRVNQEAQINEFLAPFWILTWNKSVMQTNYIAVGLCQERSLIVYHNLNLVMGEYRLQKR